MLRPIHRGVALAGDLVIVARLDARLVALNRADGKIVWDVPIDDWKRGVTTRNSAPLVVDHVIIGVSGGEYGGSAFSVIRREDRKTGMANLHHSSARRPGSETWPKDDSWKTGGGPTWLTGSYDADTDTLYWGVGNPGSLAVGPASGRQSVDRLHAGARSEHRQDQMGVSSTRRMTAGL